MKDAKKILLNSFHHIKVDGHLKLPEITDEDFEFCKAQGYMFDPPKDELHDDFMIRLQNTVKQVDPNDVANAFLYSLSTRKLEYRSALGSYWYAIAIPEHSTPKRYCTCCGWSRRIERYALDRHHGYNLHNFTRYYLGGGKICTDPDYALFDLEHFLLLPKVTPTDEDISIMNKILACVSKLEPDKKIGALHKLISSEKILKTTKDELHSLLDTLGICGIISSEEFPCYAEEFIEYIGGRSPVEMKSDYAYPVNRWYAKDGINTQRLKKVFGDKLTHDIISV